VGPKDNALHSRASGDLKKEISRDKTHVCQVQN
jgi:hypothetical protein